MKYFKLTLCTILLLGFFVFYADAGVLIVSVQESLDKPGEAFTSKAFIDRNSMRVETRSNNQNNIIIFRNDKKVFWAVNQDEKSYTEMTKEDVKAMKKSMDEAMMQMEEQLKNMPPEQRVMMEKMMKGTMSTKPSKTVYKKTASSVKVNKWICDKYEGYVNGKKDMDVWTTDWKDLGLTQEHFNVMQGMSEFFSEFTKEGSSLFKVGSNAWEKEQGYSGVPVKTVSYTEGRAGYKMELREISEQDFAPALFDLPKGLMKKEFPMMGKPRR